MSERPKRGTYYRLGSEAFARTGAKFLVCIEARACFVVRRVGDDSELLQITICESDEHFATYLAAMQENDYPHAFLTLGQTLMLCGEQMQRVKNLVDELTAWAHADEELLHG